MRYDQEAIGLRSMATVIEYSIKLGKVAPGCPSFPNFSYRSSTLLLCHANPSAIDQALRLLL